MHILSHVQCYPVIIFHIVGMDPEIDKKVFGLISFSDPNKIDRFRVSSMKTNRGIAPP